MARLRVTATMKRQLAALRDSKGNARKGGVMTVPKILGLDAWEALAARLDERQLIELLIVVGHYHMTAYLQNTLRFPPRDGNAGLGAR